MRHDDLRAGYYWAKLKSGGGRFLASVCGVPPFLTVRHVGSKEMSLLEEPHNVEYLARALPPADADSPPTPEELAVLNSRIVPATPHKRRRGY